MEDVAEDYLNELINRKLIQIATLRLNGQVYKCRIHDLIRDLAKQKADEDKFLGIFDSSKQHPGFIPLLQGQPRHSIYNGTGEYLKFFGPSYNDLKLRSLTVINESGRLELEEMKLMYTRFKNIKVLDLPSVRSNWIPEEIGNLVLLKFLGLMKCDVSSEQVLVIPPSIGKLKKLQTLRGDSKYKFPKEISELKELRHLDVANITGRLNIGSHHTKLQTLHGVRYSDWIQIDTVNLTNLNSLFIEEDELEEGNAYSLDSIANLTNLQRLNLISGNGIQTIKPLSFCKRLKNVTIWGKMNDPSELSFLPDSIRSLILWSSKFRQDPMPTLGSLSNLTSLCLYEGVYKGEKMVCNRDTFPSLQLLILGNQPNLREWQVEEGALPCLKGFKKRGCKRLGTVPERLQRVPPIPYNKSVSLKIYYAHI